jgi:hypothetical protein
MAEIDDINEGADDLKGTMSELRDVVKELAQALEKTASTAGDMAQALQDAAEGSEKNKDLTEEENELLSDAERLAKKLADEEERRKTIQEAGLQIGAAFLKQLGKVDDETSSIARRLNLSKEESTGLKQEFAAAAFQANDIAVNSVRIGKAQVALNDQLGTSVQFSNEIAATFSKLTEVVGISAESAASLAFQAQRSGETFREVEENTLAASFNLQRQSGVALDLKGVLEATGKVTGQVRANLGANPEAISRAVTAAKLFGAELDDIVASSKSLLQFESSIESELEAELLTGKQLNLERARALSLAGDQEGLARELANQAGSFSDFTKLNVIQQEKLAAAFGMSSDKLSDILFKQETQGMNAKELRALGKDELADRLEQLSLSEKLALAQEKLQTILGDIATVLMPVANVFGFIVKSIAESKFLLSSLVGILGALAVKSVINAVAQIFGSAFTLGPLGFGIATAAVGGLYAAIGSAEQQVADGIAPPGGGPFKITDKFGATAVTAAGDGIAVSPNINKTPQSQPIVIQNNWDAFQASNGNGRRGLGGTQSLQASPTFA